MRINHNIMAINAHRQLAVNQTSTSKSLQKLSSGLRINSAADDAAGLAISEKMRSQIRGLAKAQANAQDGISMIQTAEGALQQVSDILQRMRELGVQSMNGILSDSEKDAITSELKQLTQEVDRIAETSKFNNTYLLKGTLGMSADMAATDLYATVEGGTYQLKDGIEKIILRGSYKNLLYSSSKNIPDLPYDMQSRSHPYDWDGTNLLWSALVTILHALWTNDEKLLRFAAESGAWHGSGFMGNNTVFFKPSRGITGSFIN